MFDFLKKLTNAQNNNEKHTKATAYVDSSSISPDERPYYKPDEYYTFYSYPGTPMQVKVITFDERKKTSYPTRRGLYVAEVMLLEYCRKGTYPKPRSGYPGLWWFKFGIRDVGHALESLEQRGFIEWASKTQSLKGLKTEDLKQILQNDGLSVSGKKTELIERIASNIPENRIEIPNYSPKYQLTPLGVQELEDNGYIPYLNNHPHITTESDTFGEPFNVWSINKLFPNGDASNWKKVVGEIEKRRFGVDMASAEIRDNDDKKDYLSLGAEMRSYLREKQLEIKMGINTPGNGFEEESKGLDYKRIGSDKEALIQLFISIGKGFDAPALYRETSALLEKYGLYDEALKVLEAGLRNVPNANKHCKELTECKNRIEALVEKEKSL